MAGYKIITSQIIGKNTKFGWLYLKIIPIVSSKGRYTDSHKGFLETLGALLVIDWAISNFAKGLYSSSICMIAAGVNILNISLLAIFFCFEMWL